MNQRSPKLNRRHLKLALGFSLLVLVWSGLKLGLIDPTLAASGINQQLNYQGKMTVSAGTQVSDNTWNFRFRIYNASSGGSILWTERWNATTTQVTTVNGVFSVALGSLNQEDLGDVDWNNDSLYLQVDLDADGNGTWEESFTTRKRITASAYAFNTDELDGFHATSTAALANYLVALDSNKTLNLYEGGVSSTYATTTNLYIGSQLGIATSTPWANYKLAVSGNGVFDGNLYVTGNATTTGNLNVGGNATSTNGFNTQSNSHFGGGLTIDNNVTTTGQIIVGNSTFGNPSGENFKLYVNNSNLTANMDTGIYGIGQVGIMGMSSGYWLDTILEIGVVAGGKDYGLYAFSYQPGIAIYAAGDTYLGGNVTTTGYLNIGSNTPGGARFADGNLNVYNDLFVGNNATSSHFAADEFCLNNNCITSWPTGGNGAAWEFYNLEPSWNALTPTTSQASIYVMGNATTTGNLFAIGYASTTGGLFTQGNGYFGGNLSVNTSSNGYALQIGSRGTKGTAIYHLAETNNPGTTSEGGAGLAVYTYTGGPSLPYPVHSYAGKFTINGAGTYNNNYAVYGKATGGEFIYGGYFEANGALNGNYGIYASSTMDINSYAGYFNGNVYVAGNATSSQFTANEFCLGNDCITSWPINGSAWELYSSNPLQITPTTTGAGLYVTGSSTLATTTLAWNDGVSANFFRYDNIWGSWPMVQFRTKPGSVLENIGFFSDALGIYSPTYDPYLYISSNSEAATLRVNTTTNELLFGGTYKYIFDNAIHASSTSQFENLIVYNNSTTTLNSYIGGKLGVASSTAKYALQVESNGAKGIDLHHQVSTVQDGAGLNVYVNSQPSSLPDSKAYGAKIIADASTPLPYLNTIYGLYAQATGTVSSASYGGFFQSGKAVTASFGLYALSNSDAASTNYGIYAEAYGAAKNYAGYFSGDVKVVGNSTTTLNSYVGGDLTIATTTDSDFALIVEGDSLISNSTYVGLSKDTINVWKYFGGEQGVIASASNTPIGAMLNDSFVDFGALAYQPITGSSRYGAYGAIQTATTTGTNIGVYGLATNGLYNWAGYFGQGNVYVTDTLSIASTTPWSGMKLAVAGDITFGRATTTNRIYIGGTATSTIQGNLEIVGNLGGGSPLDVVTDLIVYANATTTGSQSAAEYKVGSDTVLTVNNLGSTFVGVSAGSGFVDDYGTFLGNYAGYNSARDGLTAVGFKAGYNSQTSASSYFGDNAGYNNTGDNTTAVGSGAGYNNSGSTLTALGLGAGRDNNQTNVVAIGAYAGYQNTGSEVTFVGNNSGYINSGANITAFGYYAAANNSGNRITAFGKNAAYGDNSANPYSDVIALGYNAKPTADHQLVIGSHSNLGYLTDGYFGSGVTSTNPYDFTIHASGGWNGNVNGADLRLVGGVKAGSGADGNVLLAHDGTNAIGQVGVATSTPWSNYKLAVAGNTVVAGDFYNLGNATTTGNLYLGTNEDNFVYLDEGAADDTDSSASSTAIIFDGQSNNALGVDAKMTMRSKGSDIIPYLSIDYWYKAVGGTAISNVDVFSVVSNGIGINLGSDNSDTDFIYFGEWSQRGQDTANYISWSSLQNKFEVSDNLEITGNATATGNFTVGTSTLVVVGDPSGTGVAKISIGSDNPAYNLDVKGNIVASERGGTLGDGTAGSNSGVLLNASSGAGNLLAYTVDVFNIGTRWAKDLIFKTNNTENMRVTSGGNIGIGLSNPRTKLEVSGQSILTSSSYPPVKIVRTSTGSTGHYATLELTASTTADMADTFGNHINFGLIDSANTINYLASIGAARAGADNTGDIYFDTFSTGVSSEKMRITSGGNVGIGTSTPASTLTVKGSSTFYTSSTAELWSNFQNASAATYDINRLTINSNSALASTDIYLRNSATSANYAGIISTQNLFLDTLSGTSIAFGRGMTYTSPGVEQPATIDMIIKSGAVGIATTTPGGWFGEELTVVGQMVIDTSSNTQGLTVLGAAETTERADIYVRANGALALTVENTGGSQAFVEVDPEDDQYGFIIRDSSTGAGASAAYANLYTKDTDVDYLNISVNAVTGSNGLFVNDSDYVGIGTTSPNVLLQVHANNNPVAATNLFVVSTSTNTTSIPNVKFKIQADGGYYADGALRTGHADYAEYFWTKDQNLTAGEAVCVDITRNGAVERCSRPADNNIIGIVSTNPAVIGNAPDDQPRGADYTIVALLGQIPALVSTENGEVRPGDSLTSAAIPGYLMKANAGDSTVGVALEPLSSSNGTIKVLISRRNKSLTVEQVEEKITQHIADMEIEDEVNLLIANAVDNLNLDDEINNLVDPKFVLIDSRLTVMTQALTTRIDGLDYLVNDLQSAANEFDLRLNNLENVIASFNDFASTTNATLLGFGTKITDLENGQVGLATDIDLIKSEFAQASSTIASLQNDITNLYALLENQNNNTSTSPLTVTTADLDLKTLVVQEAATFYGTIYVKGEANFESKVVFEKDIEVKGKIYASADQAGTAVVPANATSTEITFAGEYEAVPKVVANLTDENEGLFVSWKINRKTTKGFSIILQNTVDRDITFDWIALAVKGENEKPVITDFVTSGDSVSFDQSVELWAKVTDLDTTESNLTYTWSFSPQIGELHGNTGLVYWNINQTVSQDTDVTVTVTVSDGTNQASSSKVIKVLASEPIVVEEPTPEPTPSEEPTAEETTPDVVLGCLDQQATNYNQSATQDDGSCIYPEPTVVLGCLDQQALNYNQNATQDDGSCTYETDDSWVFVPSDSVGGGEL